MTAGDRRDDVGAAVAPRAHAPATVVVTGIHTAVGRALLDALAADPAIARLVAVDNLRRPPPGSPAGTDDAHGHPAGADDAHGRPVHAEDEPSSAPVLELVHPEPDEPVPVGALRGVDALVHLPADDDVIAEAADRHVGATARLLAAAREAGVPILVHLSTARAYGAAETNDVPLTEDAPLRATPEMPSAHAAARADDMVRAFAADHPDRRVVVLRPVSLLGRGVDTLVTRHLESPVLPMVRGCDPPVQFVGVDDVVAAVCLALTDPRARGAYNVSADGWLTTSDVRRLLARPTVHLPREVATGLAGGLHRVGLLSVPPGALDFLMHPWVVSCDRLRGLGWAPRESHRDLLHAFGDEHRGWLTVGRVRLRVARLLAAVGGAAAAGAVATGLVGWVAWRRRWLR